MTAGIGGERMAKLQTVPKEYPVTAIAGRAHRRAFLLRRRQLPRLWRDSGRRRSLILAGALVRAQDAGGQVPLLPAVEDSRPDYARRDLAYRGVSTGRCTPIRAIAISRARQRGVKSKPVARHARLARRGNRRYDQWRWRRSDHTGAYRRRYEPIAETGGLNPALRRQAGLDISGEMRLDAGGSRRRCSSSSRPPPC